MASKAKTSIIFIHGRLGSLEPFVLNTLRRFLATDVVVHTLVDIVYKDDDEFKGLVIKQQYALNNASCKYQTGDPIEEVVFRKKDYKQLYLVTTETQKPVLDEYFHPFSKIVGLDPLLFQKPYDLIAAVYEEFKFHSRDKLTITPYNHICHRKVLTNLDGETTSEPIFLIMFKKYYAAVYDFIDNLKFIGVYDEIKYENDVLYSFFDKVIYSMVRNTTEMNKVLVLTNRFIQDRKNRPLDFDDISELFAQLFLTYAEKEFGLDIVRKLNSTVIYTFNGKAKYYAIVKMVFLLIYSAYNEKSDLLGIRLPSIYFRSAELWQKPYFLESIEPYYDSIDIGHRLIFSKYKKKLEQDKQNVRLNYLHDEIFKQLYERDKEEIIVRIEYK